MGILIVAVLLMLVLPGAAIADPFLLMRARADIGKTARDLGLPARQWCADFINKLLDGGTHSRAAKSFARYGTPAKAGCIGCLAVMKRQRGDHVGIVADYDRRGNPILISGNHNGRVAMSVYARRRIYAWVHP